MTPLEDAFTDVAEAEIIPPEWVINDLIPVGITFLAGPPKKSYKSTKTIIMACLAARWSTSALPPWAFCELGGPTMMFSYEAQAGEVRWVIEKGLLIDPKPLTIMVADNPWSFQLHDAQSLQQLLSFLDTRRPRLVIMDPYRNMWQGDENDSGAVIATLGPIRDWLHKNHAAGIVVHHINKPAKDSSDVGSMYTMRGSSAMPGLADGIVVVEPTRQEGLITVHTTFKRGESWRRTIQLGVPGYGWPSAGYEVLPEPYLAVEALWRRPGPAPSMDAIVSTAGINSVASARQAVAALVRNERIVLTAEQHRWYLGGMP